MNKRILILTLNDYIIYQPTILNLYDKLSTEFEVEVISFQPYYATKKKDEQRNVRYLSTRYFPAQFYNKFDFIASKFTKYIRKIAPSYTYYYKYYNKYLPSLLKKAAKKYIGKVDIVIAVDLQTLYHAQQLFGAVHFLSLEIDNNTNPYYKKIDVSKVKSVFVQSKLRYDYLFPNQAPPVFYVQNAPTFSGKRFDTAGRKDFVWAGAIDKRLAILDCLAFFVRYPQFKMILKGGANPKMLAHIKEKYWQLLDEKRISINQDYLDEDQFIEFLSRFKIGFCFYDWQLIAESFNYQTAPSGKLFMCMAAGTPVIVCNIPGFQLVKKFNAGVLIDNYEPVTIFNAIEKIQANYAAYSQGCYNAAAYYSFDKNVAPYIDFLRQDVNH